MVERRQARQTALELLYQREIVGTDLKAVIQSYSAIPGNRPLPLFCLKLLNGIDLNRRRIDKMVDAYTKNWALERLPLIDRNILRMSLYEMMFEPDIPFSVSINEAIELAKAYGSPESSKFVNGVLGQVAISLAEKGAPPSNDKKEAK